MKQLKLILVALAVCISQTAQAKDQGFYAGAGFAVNNSLTACTYNVLTAACPTKYTYNSQQGANLRLIGGYDFNKYIGIEAELADLGSYDIQDSTGIFTVANVKASAFTLAARGGYKFDFGLSLFGKLGLASVNTRYTHYSLFTNFDGTHTSTGVVVGIGAQYDINDDFGVRACSETIAFDDSKISGGASGLNLLAIFRF